MCRGSSCSHVQVLAMLHRYEHVHLCEGAYDIPCGSGFMCVWEGEGNVCGGMCGILVDIDIMCRHRCMCMCVHMRVCICTCGGQGLTSLFLRIPLFIEKQ